ncbi:GLE1-like protein-domain-containing protein [Sphaerosporella brunnea]|uniref:mRNA export factor GLE1 n=1 Tax=Sphaerosporella brunnea TaxID=1250544 RepID=A0A5J5EUU1_9PEZI|nr:GLE1-like protein-domain-containing protein [Sphaerosporella brunnea]
MSTKTSAMASPRDLPSSPAQANLPPDLPNVSPSLQKMLKTKTPKKSGTYGCVREVYHPLSPLAEPSAVLFYDSDEESDDGASQKLPESDAAVDEASPLAYRGNVANLPNSKNGIAHSPISVTSAGHPTSKATSHRRPTSDMTDKANIPINRKRASQPNVSDLFGIKSDSLHIAQHNKEERPKRSRNDGFSASLDYGSSSDDCDDVKDSVDAPGAPSVEGSDTKGKGVASPNSSEGSTTKLQESPKIVSGSHHRPRQQSNTPAKTPSSTLPSKSPRLFPLPDSPEGSPLSSGDSSPFLQSSPRRNNFSPLMNRRGKSQAACQAEALAARLEILHIKAHEYSEAIARPTVDKKLARELEALFSKENRFDPKEAAALEEEYQRKIRVVYDKRVAEERRQMEFERLEHVRQQLEEEKRILLEAQKQREEEERVRREKEEVEQKKREAEAAMARAEQEKKDAEARRLAEEKAKAEQAAKAKADAAAAAAATAAQQQAAQTAPTAQAAQAAQAQSAQSGAAQEDYGRMSLATKAAGVKRIINNLKTLKNLPEQFLKDTGLKQARRQLIPKFGQLNGQKDQTLQVREAVKATLTEVMKISNTQQVPISNYLLSPPPEEVPIPVTFVWMVNEIAKMGYRQLMQECAAKPELADPIGVVIAAVFADPKFSPGGYSLVDIFVARFLKWNPVLLGEQGPDATLADRARLGYRIDDGKCETEEAYGTRMQALTAGYVALAARDFRKSKMINPHPACNLWATLASILNTPQDRLINCHFYVVHMIIQSGGGRKLCDIYGIQAKKLIEAAIGPWAAYGMQKQFQGAQAVQGWIAKLQQFEWWTKL